MTKDNQYAVERRKHSAALVCLLFAAACGDSERDRIEAQQRQDRECAADEWSAASKPECASYLARKSAAAEQTECKASGNRRQQWIQGPTEELEGRSPATFGMTAVGVCASTLRVREDDCSAAHLVEAYGDKPFMRSARQLGFRKLSCGHDEFDIAVIGR